MRNIIRTANTDHAKGLRVNRPLPHNILILKTMSTLVKSNGFPTFGSMLEDFWNEDNLFNVPFFRKEALPAVNVKDKKHAYELEVAAPGFKKDEFKISTENGLLNISAETSNEQKEENENFTRREFSCSSFSRTFNLPENVVNDDVKASYRDGLLKIELKKSGKSESIKKVINID